MVFLRVPWYSLYSSAVDATWLSDVVRTHAAAVATAVAVARIIRACCGAAKLLDLRPPAATPYLLPLLLALQTMR